MYLRSTRNLLLSPSSLLMSHSLNEGWKNMYVLSIRLISSPDNVCARHKFDNYSVIIRNTASDNN